MWKNIILTVACAAAVIPAEAELLSPQQALMRMEAESPSPLRTRGGARHDLLFTSSLDSGEAAVYVFDNAGLPGYVVLSADDAAAPVLGYSDSGSFNPSDIPPQLEWWISRYAMRIQYAREHGLPAYTPSTRADRAPVAPLISTKWDQTAPFNDLCPEIDGKHALTGCVATAMAQVMKYWNYPEVGVGNVEITLPGTSKTDKMNLAGQKFKWSDMIDWYGGDYTPAQGEAVAYLMKACGYASKMSYSTTSSGALSVHAAKALIDNFKYNKNIQFLNRDYFSASQWSDIIYAELAAERPVLYSGASLSAGHEFVCDGYSSDGYFHFNWGWAGQSDGYFLLDSLNPSDVGSGGGDGGGFNFGQDIITGIRPETSASDSPGIVQTGNLNVFVKSGAFHLSVYNNAGQGFWANMGLEAVDVSLGIAITSVDDSSIAARYATFSTTNIKAPEYEPSGNDGQYGMRYYGINGGEVAVPKNLADGRYRLTVCSKWKSAPDSDYSPVRCGNAGYNYVYFSVKGSAVTMENLNAPEMQIVNAGLESALYCGQAVKIGVTLKNESEKELTKSYYPMLLSGEKTVMKGDGVTVTVNPGETVTKVFTTLFEAEDGYTLPTTDTAFTLAFYDPATDEAYPWSGEVTMKVIDEEPVFSFSDFEVTGVPSEEIKFQNGVSSLLFTVYDISAIPFSCKLSVTQGYVGWPVYLILFSNETGQSVNISTFSETPTLGAGESMTLTCNLDFEGAETGKVYIASLGRVTDNVLEEIPGTVPVVIEIGNSGVETFGDYGNTIRLSYDAQTGEVTADSSTGITDLSVFSTDGRKIKSSAPGSSSATVSLTDLSSGIYIVKATDKNNRSKTMKVVR